MNSPMISTDQQTIVIIDDNEALSKDVYQVILELAGYRVLTASDGEAGLELLKNIHPSPEIVLVDCSMPGMDGEEFLLELQIQLPHIFIESKVVGLTSYDPRSVVFGKIKRLAFDCREKPFGIGGILKIISDYLGKPTDCAQTQVVA